MSDTILALLGFATVIAVIVLLLRNVTVPALAFVSVSTITAAILACDHSGDLPDIAKNRIYKRKSFRAFDGNRQLLWYAA